MKSVSKKIFKLLYPFMPTQYLRRFLLRSAGYIIGSKVYLPSCLKISDLRSRRNNVIIEDRVSIGPKVLIITDSSPNNSKLIKVYPLVSKDVKIGNDSWIGANVTILPGVNIGKFCVIGSGSVVNKNIPDYTVAVGSPARLIKSINPSDLINDSEI